MSIYDKLGAKTASIKARPMEKPAEKTPRTGPGIHLDATARMYAAEERAEELEELLKHAGAGSALKIKLSEIHEVAGRRRKLSKEEYDELRENLSKNELVTPITVRPRVGGGYEIISGHNRTQIYRELKRIDIPAIVQNTDDIQSDLNAFYANLLHPNLPDYQKYLGFKMIKRRKPDSTIEEIAALTGKSQRHIERLMKFDDLPKEALEILSNSSIDLGGNAVEDFAKLAKAGKIKKVIEAIQKLESGELNQKQAISYAASTQEEKKSIKQNNPIVIKQGRSTYCTVRQASKVLRIEFGSKEEAEVAQEIVKSALEKLAIDRKN
jgi:ParB family chromosome partitioning protein